MQRERKALVEIAFPRLRRLCLERGTELRFVDLRWGVSDQQASEEGVVDACLSQIDRCRPYFLCLLGQRYGSIASSVSLRLKRRLPWLVAHPTISLTELEIRYAALEGEEPEHNRALFYLRDDAWIKSLAEEDRADYLEADTGKHQRQSALRREVLASGFPSFTYDDPLVLADQVVQDLWADLQDVVGAALPAKGAKQPTYIEIINDKKGTKRVQASLLKYFRSRNAAADNLVSTQFIDQRGRLNAIDRLGASGNSVVVVPGEPGSGKSTLLRALKRSARQEGRSVIGIHSQEVGHHPLNTYLYWILSGATDEPVWNNNRLDGTAVMDALAETRGEVPTLIAIDGAEKETFEALAWTAGGLPKGHLLVIATSRPEAIPDPLPAGWSVYNCLPPDRSEAKVFFEQYFEQYGKRLDPGQVELLLKAALGLSFGALKSMAEELRVFGEFEELNDAIAQLVLDRNGIEFHANLCKWIIATLGEGLGKCLERLLVGLATIREGSMRDTEALAYLGTTELTFVQLLAAASPLLDDETPYIVKLRTPAIAAVKREFLGTDALEHAANMKIADGYVQHLVDVTGEKGIQVDNGSSLALRAYHLAKAKEWDAFDEALRPHEGDKAYLQTLNQAQVLTSDYGSDPCWCYVQTRIGRRSENSLLCEGYYIPGLRALTEATDTELVSRFLAEARYFALNTQVDKIDLGRGLQNAVKLCSKQTASYGDALFEGYFALGWIALERGEAEKACDWFLEAENYLPPADEASLSKIQLEISKAQVLMVVGQHDAAAEIAVGAMSAALSVQIGEQEFVHIAQAFANTVRNAQMQTEEIDKVIERVLLRCELGSDTSRLARASLLLSSGGMKIRDPSRRQYALAQFQEVRKTIDCDADPVIYASSLANEAYVHLCENRLQEAEAFAREATSVKGPDLSELHRVQASCYAMLADLLEKQERFEEAEQARKAPEAANTDNSRTS